MLVWGFSHTSCMSTVGSETGTVSRRLNLWATRMGILILVVPESGGISHYSDGGITLGIFSFCGGPV